MTATQTPLDGQQILLGNQLWTYRRIPGQVRLEISQHNRMLPGWEGQDITIGDKSYRCIKANRRSLYLVPHLPPQP